MKMQPIESARNFCDLLLGFNENDDNRWQPDLADISNLPDSKFSSGPSVVGLNPSDAELAIPQLGRLEFDSLNRRFGSKLSGGSLMMKRPNTLAVHTVALPTRTRRAAQVNHGIGRTYEAAAPIDRTITAK